MVTAPGKYMNRKVKAMNKLTTTLLAMGAVAAAPVLANAESFSGACNPQSLNVGVKMTQDPFFRQFHNQDLVQSINQLRKAAEADMAAGATEACGIKAATINAMVKDPAHARVTLADYQSRQAAATGAAVANTHSVPTGPHYTQAQLMGMPLRSLNNDIVGTITGVIYSQSGQPLYVTVTPPASVQAKTATGSLTVPVGMLLVGATKADMYVSLNSQDFWNEPRFREAAIQPAG